MMNSLSGIVLLSCVVLVGCVVLVADAAIAQQPQQPQQSQQADPAFMAKAIQTLQQQRNNALDQLAAEQARRLMLEDEVTKLKAELEAAKKELPK